MNEEWDSALIIDEDNSPSPLSMPNLTSDSCAGTRKNVGPIQTSNDFVPLVPEANSVANVSEIVRAPNASDPSAANSSAAANESSATSMELPGPSATPSVPTTSLQAHSVSPEHPVVIPDSPTGPPSANTIPLMASIMDSAAVTGPGSLPAPPTEPEPLPDPPTGPVEFPSPPVDATWDANAMDNVEYEVITINVNGVEKTVHIPVPKGKAVQKTTSSIASNKSVTQSDILPKKSSVNHAHQLGILKNSGGRWGKVSSAKSRAANNQIITVQSNTNPMPALVALPSGASNTAGQLVTVGGTMLVLPGNAPGTVGQNSNQLLPSGPSVAVAQPATSLPTIQSSNTSQIPPNLVFNSPGSIVLNSSRAAPAATIGQTVIGQPGPVNATALRSSTLTPGPAGGLTSPPTVLQLAPSTTSGGQMFVLPPGFSIAPVPSIQGLGNATPCTTSSSTLQSPIILQQSPNSATIPRPTIPQTLSIQGVSKSSHIVTQPMAIQPMQTINKPPQPASQTPITGITFGPISTTQVSKTPNLSQQPIRIQLGPTTLGTVPSSQVNKAQSYPQQPLQFQLKLPSTTLSSNPQQPAALLISQPNINAPNPVANTPILIGQQGLTTSIAGGNSNASPHSNMATQVMQGLGREAQGTFQLLSPLARSDSTTPSISIRTSQPQSLSNVPYSSTTLTARSASSSNFGPSAQNIIRRVSPLTKTAKTSAPLNKSSSGILIPVTGKGSSANRTSLPVAVVAPTGNTLATGITGVQADLRGLAPITGVMSTVTSTNSPSQPAASAVYIIDKNGSSGLKLLSEPTSSVNLDQQGLLNSQQLSEQREKKKQQLAMAHTKMMSAQVFAAKRIKQMKSKAKKTGFRKFPEIKPKQGILLHPLTSPSPSKSLNESQLAKKSPGITGTIFHDTSNLNRVGLGGSDVCSAEEIKNLNKRKLSTANEEVGKKATWEIVSDSDAWSPSSDESSGSEYQPGVVKGHRKVKKRRVTRRQPRHNYFPEESERVTRKCAQLLSYLTDTDESEDTPVRNSASMTTTECSVVLPRLALRRRTTVDLGRKEVEFENCIPWECKLCERGMFGSSASSR